MSKEDFANKIASSVEKAKQNSINEAKRLEQKVKSYNASNQSNSDLVKNNSSQNNKQNNNSNLKQKLKNKAGSAALQAVGVPKEVSDKAMDFAQSEKGQKMIKKMNEQQLGPIAGSLMNKAMYGESKSEEDSGSESVFGNVKFTMKLLKYGTMIFVPILAIVIFCNLFISAFQVYQNVIGVGQADEMSASDADDKINNAKEEDLNKETTTYYNVTLERKYYANKSSVVPMKRETVREDTEVDLSELEDFYGKDFDEKMDMEIVRNFLFKIHDIYIRYQKKYMVSLDMPLLMSTLMMQSKEMSIVFSANTTELYDRTDIEDISKVELSPLDFDYDWSDYKINYNKSAHDIEILAKNMVRKTTTQTCTRVTQDADGNYIREITKEQIDYDIEDKFFEPGQEYYLDCEGNEYSISSVYKYDKDKYDEFLQQFLEKKYFLDPNVEYPIDKPPRKESTNDNTQEDSNESEDYETDSEENEDNKENVDFEEINNDKNVSTNTNWRTWLQCDPIWGDYKLGSSSETMCRSGCLVTSIAIQIARSGTAITTDYIDPGVASKEFSFDSNGNFLWDGIKNLSPNFYRKTKVYLTGLSKEAIADKLASYDSASTYFVLKVEGSGSPQHYVAVDYVDYNTNDIYIIDPLSTSRTRVYDYYKVSLVHILEKKD